MNQQSVLALDTRLSFMKKTFGIASVAFLLVTLIGYLTSVTIDSTGVIKEALNGSGKYNFNIYRSVALQSSVATLGKVSVAAIVLIIASSILSFVWAFRALTASRGFIFFVYGLYIIAQGLGFGLLFVTWKATDLLGVFGIAGGLFGVMAIIGYFSKNLLPLGKWLFYGSLALIPLFIVVIVLNVTGSSGGVTSGIIWSVFGVLTLGWIAFDIWLIKRTAIFVEGSSSSDPEIEFRLMMWMSFKLLSDMVALIWIVARFYSRVRR